MEGNLYSTARSTVPQKMTGIIYSSALQKTTCIPNPRIQHILQDVPNIRHVYQKFLGFLGRSVSKICLGRLKRQPVFYSVTESNFRFRIPQQNLYSRSSQCIMCILGCPEKQPVLQNIPDGDPYSTTSQKLEGVVRRPRRQ